MSDLKNNNIAVELIPCKVCNNNKTVELIPQLKGDYCRNSEWFLYLKQNTTKCAWGATPALPRGGGKKELCGDPSSGVTPQGLYQRSNIEDVEPKIYLPRAGSAFLVSHPNQSFPLPTCSIPLSTRSTSSCRLKQIFSPHPLLLNTFFLLSHYSLHLHN